MNIGTTVLLCLLAGPVFAQSVYKCKTPQGVVYSQSPCGDEAEKRSVKSSASASASGSSEVASGPTGPFVEVSRDELFDIGRSAEAVLKHWGPPAARYHKGEEERWFYPNRGMVENGQRVCFELHFEGGSYYQITHLPEDVMAKSVLAARRIGNWRPPSTPPKRSFYMIGGPDARGSSKATMLARYGEPDLKKVFNGIEVWEYRGIQMAPNNPQTLTMFVEYDGDRVIQTIGN